MAGDQKAGGLRAITAVIALYAFVLQVFLGTLMPLPAHGHADPLCSGLVDGVAVDADRGPAGSGHGAHKLCCTSVAAVSGAVQPGLSSSETVWPAQAVTRLTWRDEARPGARGPPGSISQPRGPPVT